MAALYTVIVADDEDELREAVCTMIPWEDYGFCLVGNASNGLDALQLVEKHEPDLLLTDIRMPFISGIELARQVREIRPATNIAFLSGYDDFEYAKQAIQYNIISYMLKPLTLEGLGAELRNIRQKIDAQFALFRQAVPRADEQDLRAAFLMPLVLDDYPDPDGAAQAEALARQCGLLRDADDHPYYTVMVSILLNEDGSNCTDPSFPSSVHTLSEKYLRGSSFFASGKVISVLLGNPSDFEEYLHILADEIPQMASRVLGKRCRIGVSRPANSLSALHDAYREAMEALRQGDKMEAGAQFISDLAPAVKGGQSAVQAGAGYSGPILYGCGPLSGIAERDAGRQPQPSQRLYQKICRRDLYQHPHPQAHGGRPGSAEHLLPENPGDCPAVRLHRSALLQLLL